MLYTMPDQELSPAQVMQLTQAMLSVAYIDDLHPAEAALIGQFYESSRNDDMPSTASVLSNPQARQFDAQALAGCPAAFADTVVLLCLMTGYADGHLSAAERSHIQAIATALGLDAARFAALLAQVQDQLTAALAHLPDAASVANVVRTL